MTGNSVLVLGSGHLAHRVHRLVADKGYTVTHFSTLVPCPPQSEFSTIDAIEAAFGNVNLQALSMIYVLYDTDEDNLEMVIALMALHADLPVSTALFNENLSPHLQAANLNLQILNPARLSAPVFVDCLYEPGDAGKMPVHTLHRNKIRKTGNRSLTQFLVAAFLFLIVSAATYFHFYEHLSWLDSFYFVIVTVGTVGYGDITLQHAVPLSKIVAIVLILGSTTLITVIFSLVIDRIIKQREQISLGRKKYHCRNHVILCGLGRLGYFIADMLHQRGEKVVIVESQEVTDNVEHFRNLKMNVYTGNARQPKVLQDVGAEYCRALISVTNDDYANLEIALNVRHYQPNARLILRIFDEGMAKTIKDKFDVYLTQSVSFIAAGEFASLLDHR